MSARPSLCSRSFAFVGLPLLFAGTLAAACDDVQTVSDVDGGGGASTSAGPDYSDLCRGACAAAETCLPELDVQACETQCAVEMAGGGYLMQEAAKDYFGFLDAAGSDEDCAGTNLHRYFAPVDGSAFTIPCEEPEVMSECVGQLLDCDPNQDHGMVEQGCYLSFYRWNAQRRADVRLCWDVPCQDLEYFRTKCVCQKQPGGRPWFGQGPPEPNPYECPWMFE